MQIVVLKGFKEDLSTMLYDTQSLAIEADPAHDSNSALGSFLHRFREIRVANGGVSNDMGNDCLNYLKGLPCPPVNLGHVGDVESTPSLV